MLVIFYIVSASAAVFASVFFKHGNFKQWAVSMLVTIITGVAFCLPTIQKIVSDLRHVEFWQIFMVLSLITWQLTFISLDEGNLFIYEVAAILLTFTVCSICSTIYPTNVRESCRIEHVSIETVNILTSIDDTESKVDIYGEGFIIKKFKKPSLKNSVYQYSYMQENGIIAEKEIPARYTQICYIENGESPYLEIITTRDCFGYYPETQKHILTTSTISYILYIPEDCILTVVELT